MSATIGLVDYGMGNRRSVHKALERVGARVVQSSDPATLAASDGLVVPGVGAFPAAMQNLDRLGLSELVRERASAGTPVLGICLGMQLLFEGSEEIERTQGLGLVPGEVRWLRDTGLRIPHIGWNEVSFRRASPLTYGLPERGCAFYHVHSLAPHPRGPADVVATAEYGEAFATIVQRGSVFGVQFHPEKSSVDGLRLLENFARLCTERELAVGGVAAGA